MLRSTSALISRREPSGSPRKSAPRAAPPGQDFTTPRNAGDTGSVRSAHSVLATASRAEAFGTRRRSAPAASAAASRSRSPSGVSAATSSSRVRPRAPAAVSPSAEATEYGDQAKPASGRRATRPCRASAKRRSGAVTPPICQPRPRCPTARAAHPPRSRPPGGTRPALAPAGLSAARTRVPGPAPGTDSAWWDAGVRRLLPEPAGDLTADDLLAAYAPPEDWPRHVRVNFVASADGASSVDGLSGGLSSPADKRVFDLLRDLADVILVGAGTARAEGYGYPPYGADRRARRRALGLAELPTFAVVSGRLDLDPDLETLRRRPGPRPWCSPPRPRRPRRGPPWSRSPSSWSRATGTSISPPGWTRSPTAACAAILVRGRTHAARRPGRRRPAGRAVPDGRPAARRPGPGPDHRRRRARAATAALGHVLTEDGALFLRYPLTPPRRS